MSLDFLRGGTTFLRRTAMLDSNATERGGAQHGRRQQRAAPPPRIPEDCRGHRGHRGYTHGSRDARGGRGSLQECAAAEPRVVVVVHAALLLVRSRLSLTLRFAARTSFRHAENPMTSKIMPLADAVGRFVKARHTIALAGFTHLIPSAAGHEVIRQGRRDLTLVRMTPDIIYDQLIGMGCAKALVFSWGGNPGR